MATQNPPFVKVYNALPTTVGANSITNAGGIISIRDGSASAEALYDFLTTNAIAGSKRTRALVESGKVATLTIQAAAAAADMVTSFNMSQEIGSAFDSGEAGGDGLVLQRIQYTATSADTTTTIADQFVLLINALSDAGQLKVTAANVGAVITVTAMAGAPLWTVSGQTVANIVEANAMGATTGSAAPSNVNGVVTLTVAANHVATVPTFVAGDTVLLAGFADGNGAYVVQSNPYILDPTDTTHLLIFDKTNAINASSGARTITVVAQDALNTGSLLTADGLAENLTFADGTAASAIGATTLYTKSEFHFYDMKGVGGFNQSSGDQRYVLDMYIDQSITSANYDAAEIAIDAVLAAIPS